MRKTLFVFGTRPEAIKMAPLIKELQKHHELFDVRVCVTGQHKEMLYQVLDFFQIVPDYDLEVMKPNQSLFNVTADILTRLEPVLDQENPDVVVVQGDTTSVLAGALAAFYKKIKVAHLEAGLRSGDLYSPFPEEGNRLVVSRLTDYHFTPTARATRNLEKENIRSEEIHQVGNTVVDALLLAKEMITGNEDELVAAAVPSLRADDKLVLVTGHRRESFGSGFEDICHALAQLAAQNPDVHFVYPVHLNPNVQEPVDRILGQIENVHLIKPVDYPTLIALLSRSYFVMTDSGGIQEEAPALGKPVLVMRQVTERQEGVDAGTAKLVGTATADLVQAAQQLLDDQSAYQKMANAVNPYGDGTASTQIARVLAL